MAAVSQPGQDMDVHLDVSDNARKRCASSANDERAVKAIKLEPTTMDPHLNTATNSALATPIGKYSPPNTANSTMSMPTMSNPTTPSSYTLPNVADYNLMSNATAPVSQNGLDVGSIPPVQQDFVMARRNTWSERPPTLQHRHTLSGGSGLTANDLNSAMGHGASAGLVSSALPPFTAAGSFGPPPIPPLSAGPDVVPSGIPRTARSMSLTAPYSRPTFPIGMDGTIPSLPSTFPDGTTIDDMHHFPTDELTFMSSPEEDSEDGPSSGGHSPARGRGEASRPSTSSGPSRLPSRTRPEAVANEIPPEYRAEVDRIFFNFLQRICSDRGSSAFFPRVSVELTRTEQSMPRTRRANSFIRR
jgi:hypothetical protein